VWSTRVRGIKRVVFRSYDDIRTDEIVSPPPRRDHLLLDIVVAVVAQYYCDRTCVYYNIIVDANHIITRIYVCIVVCTHANYFRTTTPAYLQYTVIVVVTRRGAPHHRAGGDDGRV